MENPPSKHDLQRVYLDNVRDNKIGINGQGGITPEVAADLGYQPPVETVSLPQQEEQPIENRYWPNAEQRDAADNGLNGPGGFRDIQREKDPNSPSAQKHAADTAWNAREARDASNAAAEVASPPPSSSELPEQTEPY